MSNVRKKNENQKSDNECVSMFQQFLSETGYSHEELHFRTFAGKDQLPRDIQLFYEKNGDVHIPYFSIDGTVLQYSCKNKKLRDFERIRFAKPEDGKGKYTQPAGSGQHLYHTPEVIKRFRNKIPIHDFFLVEGEKKALAANKKLGLPFSALPGIYGYKDNYLKNSIDADFLKLIEICKVKRIILVYDADSLISKFDKNNPDKDLYQRANGFFTAVSRFKELVAIYDLDLYLVIINPALDKKPKGLDDLLLAYPDRIEDIKGEFENLTTGEKHFSIWRNVSGSSDSKLREFFGLNNAERFYEIYKEEIGENSFVLKHRKYRFDGEKLMQLKAENPNIFWKAIRDGEGNIKACKIEIYMLIQFLELNGFKRIELPDIETINFLRIADNKIFEVSESQIQDFVINYIKDLPDGILTNGVIKEDILKTIYQNPQGFFSKNKLSTIESAKLKIKGDTRDAAFIYFKNGFVKITDEKYELHNYQEMDSGFIYNSQIQERNFEPGTEDCNFKEFVKKISGYDDDPERFLALRVLLGYLMHDYYEYKRKAVNLTDSSISDDDEGRTGKTLLIRATKYMRNYREIPGKSFSTFNKHKYQDATLSTQIIHLNDIARSFSLNDIYNDITDGISVDKKNEKPFTINAKMAISSNKPLRVSGASARDRILEFELAQHYSDTFSPEQEFNQWFFSDWNEKDWKDFDNFMVECIRLFFKHGLINARSINLENRKLLNETNQEFIDFMESRLVNIPSPRDNREDDEEEVCPGIEFSKKLLHTNFLKEYPEFENDKFLKKQSTFTRYLKTFATYRGFETGERKSGANRYMVFKIKQSDK